MLRKAKYKYKSRKSHFSLGDSREREGKLYLRRTFSNIFLTFCDLENQVIKCVTSGMVVESNSKRRKRIAQAVEDIMYYMSKYLRFYKISKVHLIFKIKVKSHVYTLVNRLKYHGFLIGSMCSRLCTAHNGVRGKKLRRL